MTAARDTPRPAAAAGPMVWLHTDTAAGRDTLVPLSDALLDADPVLSVLLTHPAGTAPPPEVPRRHARCCAPDDPALARAMRRHRPAAVLVLADPLPTGMLARWHTAATPVLVAEATAPRLRPAGPRWPGHARRALRRLTHVYLAGARWRAAWRARGLGDDRLTALGRLSQAPMALRCNTAERDTLAGAFRQRTLWLAAGVPRSEEDLVAAAHAEALRESHRVGLILHPDDPHRGPALQARLAPQFTTALRSRDEPITPETQVYIADTEGERGLWYRLAVAGYAGGSLTTGATLSPMEAAALGCAIVHGPEAGRHGAAFEQLADANATLRLTHPDGLGPAICSALRPDHAAELAHRGWDVISAGAEATQTLVDALLAAGAKAPG